jgi:hypothetical protein
MNNLAWIFMTDNHKNGGASRDRTDDPLLAKQVLSQLSYGPLTCLFSAILRCVSLSVGHIASAMLVPSLVTRLD